MLFKQEHLPDTAFYKKWHTFTDPCQLRIRHKDGTESLVGYGVGEAIETLAPCSVLITTNEKLKEIPLADGSVVIEYWDQYGNNLMADATATYHITRIYSFPQYDPESHPEAAAQLQKQDQEPSYSI